MTISQLPSGSWRIQQMYQGKRYSKTVKYKPTKKEAMELILAEMDVSKNDFILGKKTFSSAATEYTDFKSNILSPRTIREYKLIPARLPEWFTKKYINDITEIDIQKMVNELSATNKPKTVRNLCGFVSAVFAKFRPSFRYNVDLPKQTHKEAEIPSKEDVTAILDYINVHYPQYNVALRLALFGLRRSEICALKITDLDGDVLHINKALVQSDSGEWVIKSTKTDKSTRDIVIPLELAKLIKEQGCIYTGHPENITRTLAKAERALGLPIYSVHKLRHFFASSLFTMGCDRKTVMDLGGWTYNSRVLDDVYTHSLTAKTEDGKREIASRLSSFIS